MHRLSVAIALVLSCTAAPVTAPSPSPTGTATSSPTAAAPTSSPLPIAFTDLKVSAAGVVAGAHALVAQIVDSPGGPSLHVWDVPLDGPAPRQLVAYTRAHSDWDVFSLPHQLSPNGNLLALSDPVDVAGRGLAIVDLVDGATSMIRLTIGASQPAWSPDGQRIAFRGFSNVGPLERDEGVWVVGVRGADLRRVTPSGLAAGSGAITIFGWTDDGSGVLFGPNTSTISVADVASGTVTRVGGAVNGLLPAAVRRKRPSIAIVFHDDVAQGPSVGHVEVRDTVLAPGQTVIRYGPGEGTFLTDPRWNPANDEILLFYAYGQGVQARDELVIVDGVTARTRRLATPSFVRSADWTADGSRILYADLASVRVRNADGSGDRELFHPVLPSGGVQQFVGGVVTFAPR
jgi:WD40 repeat protein